MARSRSPTLTLTLRGSTSIRCGTLTSGGNIKQKKARHRGLGVLRVKYRNDRKESYSDWSVRKSLCGLVPVHTTLLTLALAITVEGRSSEQAAASGAVST